MAAARETGSRHPLAVAILARAAADGVEPGRVTDARALGGKGVAGTVDGIEAFLGSPKEAATRVMLGADLQSRIDSLNHEGRTVSVLIIGNTLAGAIAMRDEPRPDAKPGLAALSGAGLKTVMLTGDNRRTAEAVGRELGIDVLAELLPQDKQRVVGELQATGHRVAKVGDGINDAPALAAAYVGIAMGGGADVARDGRRGCAARTRDRHRRNDRPVEAYDGQHPPEHHIALGLKVVFLGTTIAGITGLWPAILTDTGATVLVTANAMRLLKGRTAAS